MSQKTALGLLLCSLGTAPAFAQPQSPGGVAVSPAVIAQQAMQACEAHVRVSLSPWTGNLVGIRAGSEQDGFILVTGRIAWRGDAQSPFSCTYERAQNRIAAAVVPSESPPSEPLPGRRGSAGESPSAHAACLEAVTSLVQQAHQAAPSFDGEPRLGPLPPESGFSAAPNAQGLIGTGSFPAQPGAVRARASQAQRFSYYCENPSSFMAQATMRAGFRLIN